MLGQNQILLIKTMLLLEFFQFSDQGRN